MERTEGRALELDGVLIVDKPKGLTSFDVVRRLRSLGSGKKAGHTGTLDPDATGVLPVCLGEATKLVPFLMDGDKAYEGLIRLGVETDTYDASGKVVAEAEVAHLDEAAVREKLLAMAGEYWQTPPMYSAVRVGGKRLYELARQGEEVERKPRKVRIEAVELRGWEPATATASFFIHVSKGTYVRSIAHELGEALGVGGHLAALRRVWTGPFSLEQAQPLERLVEWMKEGRRDEIAAHLLDTNQALAHLPEVRVDDLQARRVLNGIRLSQRDLLLCRAPELEEGSRLRVVDRKGGLLAVAEQNEGRLRYARVFPRKPGE